ncbi:MAG: MogA/MoaB family molybdenum cofactor biosynthesis protein [Anaerolineae bacterium]|nr:MogA/MoaB family molybdenum cofactor biosynthesis protein [Anaerolineae bacterium]
MKIGVLTISDRGASGEYEDLSGPVITKIISDNLNWQVSHQAIVPDDVTIIAESLRHWCDQNVQLILTTGGTGFSPRDVTPEATRQVIEREAPGIAEGLRAESLKITKHAMLSRGIAGIRGQTLIINLPGSPKAVRENMQVLLPILPHALELLNNDAGSEQSHRTV